MNSLLFSAKVSKLPAKKISKFPEKLAQIKSIFAGKLFLANKKSKFLRHFLDLAPFSEKKLTTVATRLSSGSYSYVSENSNGT